MFLRTLWIGSQSKQYRWGWLTSVPGTSKVPGQARRISHFVNLHGENEDLALLSHNAAPAVLRTQSGSEQTKEM